MIKYFTRLIAGFSLGGQKGFAKSINTVFDILENLEGEPFSGIRIKRNGKIWRIGYDGSQGGGSGEAWDGTAPDGFEWETLNIVTDGKIVTREVLVKSATSADVETWDEDDARLLLQVKGGTGDDAGLLRIDKGYLKE
jgi:hypothetical protein